MECKEVMEKIHDFVEESIEEDKKSEIKAHLNECSLCKEEYRVMENSIKVLKEIKTVTPEADKMWGKISKKISEKKRKTSFYVPGAIAIPVCIILIVFLGILLRNIKKENTVKQEIKQLYSLMSENNYSDSLKKAQRLIASSEQTKFLPELMFIEGKCNEKLGNKKEAMKIYREITEKFPGTDFAAESFYIAGLDYEQSGNFPEAVKNYSYIIDNHVYKKLWFFEDMAVRLKTCETILSEEERLLAVRGANKQELSHQENLKRISDIIEKSFPDKKEEIEIKEAELFIEKGEFQKSLNIAENLIENKDDHIKLSGMLIKGKSLYRMGNFPEAEKEFQKIIKDYPLNENQRNEVLLYLGKIKTLR